MSQTLVAQAPLFQSSLREWQAAWRANREQTEESPELEAARRFLGVSTPSRRVRLPRRKRQSSPV